MKYHIKYRRWKFENRNTINYLSRVDGEIQADISFPVSSNVDLTYQGIFGGSPNFQVNVANQTGLVNNFPIQNGVILGFTYTAS
ncbi:TPA: hypothetical protein JA361_13655 [Legionella pneumophila]|nr:hypothetical protein [Legionella pneumophila]HAT8182328.1 hypothetical protein [Legionella pneumophila]